MPLRAQRTAGDASGQHEVRFGRPSPLVTGVASGGGSPSQEVDAAWGERDVQAVGPGGRTVAQEALGGQQVDQHDRRRTQALESDAAVGRAVGQVDDDQVAGVSLLLCGLFSLLAAITLGIAKYSARDLETNRRSIM